MKSLNTFLTTLVIIILTVVSASAQYVTVGTTTGQNAVGNASPINIWYESMHYQTVYTVAELQAAGIQHPRFHYSCTVVSAVY